MNPAAVAAVVSLIQNAILAMEALKAVSEMIARKQAAGQDVTLDDLKELQINDGPAREALVSAIEEAERG